MTAGFSSLYVLKKHLLASSLTANKQFDEVILHLGLGIAARIEKLCNRKLTYAAGYQEILPADRANFLLSRFPVQSVATIELKLTDVEGWIVQPASFVNTIDLESGIVMLPEGCDAGPFYAQVRFTYTGGFWWSVLGPDDAGYPDAPPENASLLPGEIKAAWLMQCEYIWSKRDKLGLSTSDAPGVQSDLTGIKLLPLVEEMIQPHIRYRMT